MDHTPREHKYYDRSVLAASQAGLLGTVIKKMILSGSEKKIYGWKEDVVGDLEHFSFVKRSLIREHMKLKQISTETLSK